MPIEREEETYARTLLEQKYAARLAKIPESRKMSVKTPDFHLLSDLGEPIAVIEVKRLQRVPRTEENGWQVEKRDSITQATRRDNGPGRVANCIHEAHKQLSTSSLPRVLLFVNEESLLDNADLDEAFNGRLFYGNEAFGYFNTASKKIGEGRIQAEKVAIDLYIWIDRLRDDQHYFRFVTKAGAELARRSFAYTEADGEP